MSVEILTITPASGEYPERNYGEHFNFRLWVKFKDNNGEEWVGCFSKAYESTLCEALVNEDNTRGFVVAGGKGYLVNIDTKELVVELEEPPLIESAIVTKNPDYFLVGTFFSVYVLNGNGLIKEIRPDRIIDGIYFSFQKDNKAFGELASAENQYKANIPFEFDLITFNLIFQLNSESGWWEKIWKKFFVL